MRRVLAAFTSLSLALVLAACGSKEQPKVDAPKTPASTTPAATSHAAPAASTTAAPKKEDDWHDPHEIAVRAELKPLFEKTIAKSKFPKATAGDKKCWEDIGLTGDHEKDHAAVVKACGEPTGMLQYAAPHKGRLHHKHDPRDEFIVKLHGGFCYRYYAIADGTMEDMDILIKKKNGALLGEDKTKSPVAIINNAEPWCMDSDEELHFDVEVDGPGHGYYLFTIWARPKK